MKKIRLDLAEKSYDILIGSGAAGKLPELLRSYNHTGPVVVVTDNKVKSKTSALINPVLKRVKNQLVTISVPATERSKSISIFRDSVQKISKKTRTHRPLIVALGGGVVGDLAGFIAATYRRGVPLIQVPTTLLAQVDSSVGGKVGIDLPEAKNLIGAFYQPRAVLMDPELLNTLPKKQIRNGMAEVIKYGVISSPSLFGYLEKNIERILMLEKKPLEKIISDCVSIKARVVEKDEYDLKDVRIALNFGHTLGHAIEAASEYSKRYNHGECVAIGMLLACEIAVRLDMLKYEQLGRLVKLLRKTGLPTRVRKIPLKEILKSYKYDKKFTKGGNRMVLPRKIGKVEVVEDIPDLLIKTVVKEYVTP
ncbi:MAG: 3-dehydroquinate synthase [Candidatus Omnitrophica bacterium]|nr:3-dehydroquinate synthase [Candidatus Omnitrophota bacterium]